MEKIPCFLCDEMLGSLCRYLRAAGYDTAFANNGARDAELLQQCHAEGRYFITQDTLIREHKAADSITLIMPHAPLDQLAALVGERFQLDWMYRPFTRCLVDNTILVEADEISMKKAPPDTHRPEEPLHHCPQCGRVYWRGSHYRRMKERLLKWQQHDTVAIGQA